MSSKTVEKSCNSIPSTIGVHVFPSIFIRGFQRIFGPFLFFALLSTTPGFAFEAGRILNFPGIHGQIQTEGEVRLPENASEAFIETGNTGQIMLVASEGIEIRMKENSRISFPAPKQIRLEKGLIGFRIPQKNRELMITTPWAKLRFCQGIFVAKLYPSMTRLGMLKGFLEIISPGEDPKPLENDQERGICTQEISSPYKTLEDLFFAWYWDKKP